MSLATEQLLDDIMALSEEDRLILMEALVASLQPAEGPPFDESWRAIIERRSAELRSGKVVPIPWAEVKRQARERARD